MHVPRKCVTYVRACTLGNYVQTHVHDYPRVDNTRGNGSSRSVLAMKYDRSFVCIGQKKDRSRRIAKHPDGRGRIDERSEQQFQRESHHFEVELFSRMSFLLPRTLCVSVSFYTTFLPFIELVGRSDFYISVTSMIAILPRNRVTSVESSRRATLYVFVYVAQRGVTF